MKTIIHRTASLVALLAAGAACLTDVTAQEARSVGPVATFMTAEGTPPTRFKFERWMDTGRKAAERGWPGYAKRHFASAMLQAWQIVPAEYLAFEDLGNALVKIDLLPEAAFCYHQALEILRSKKEIDSAAIAARIDKKLGALPADARKTMRPLVPPPVSEDELKRRRAAIPLEDALKAFYRDLMVLPAARLKDVMAAVLPAEEDIQALFPERAYEVWPHVEASNQKQLASVADMAKEAKEAGAIQSVLETQLIGDNRGDYEGVLTLMAPDTVAFTAILRRASGDTESAVYIWINGRWVWIRNLIEIPALIQKE